jgi:hypothetical protein
MSAWLLGCAAVVSETAMDWKGDPGSDGKENSVLLLPPLLFWLSSLARWLSLTTLCRSIRRMIGGTGGGGEGRQHRYSPAL